MNPNYETTPTPLADLEDGQEVITSTGAEGVIMHYGSGSSHNVRLRLLEEEDHTLPQPVIEALNLKFYKKPKPTEFEHDGVAVTQYGGSLRVQRINSSLFVTLGADEVAALRAYFASEGE